MTKTLELDLLVAREIFGINKVYYMNDDFVLGLKGNEDELYYIPSGKPLRTHKIDAVPLPRYSSQDAWKIVEKMVVDGYVFDIVVSSEGSQAWFTNKEGHRGEIVKKPTSSLAICIAALVFLGVLEPKTEVPAG